MTPVKLLVYSITPVWLLVALAAVLTLTLVPVDQHLLWLSLTMAVAIILTFGVQLTLDRKPGLGNRLMASFGGALLILAIATGVSALLG